MKNKWMKRFCHMREVPQPIKAVAEPGAKDFTPSHCIWPGQPTFFFFRQEQWIATKRKSFKGIPMVSGKEGLSTEIQPVSSDSKLAPASELARMLEFWQSDVFLLEFSADRSIVGPQGSQKEPVTSWSILTWPSAYSAASLKSPSPSLFLAPSLLKASRTTENIGGMKPRHVAGQQESQSPRCHQLDLLTRPRGTEGREKGSDEAKWAGGT